MRGSFEIQIRRPMHLVDYCHESHSSPKWIHEPFYSSNIKYTYLWDYLNMERGVPSQSEREPNLKNATHFRIRFDRKL